MNLVERVVHRYLSAVNKIAKVILVDVNGTLEVSGKYTEMQTVMPRLKSLGFRWDPTKKVWYGSAAHLTPLKRKNLDKLIAEANGEAPPGADPEEIKRKQEELLLKRKVHEDKINALLDKRRDG